jgi:hypothetical protein
MNKFLFLFVAFLIPFIGFGQYISSVSTPDKSIELNTDSTDLSNKYAAVITKEKLSDHLHVLASDEYEGRETGTAGNDKAAKYIADYFRSLGLPAIGIENSYYQNVAFNRTGWAKNEMTVNGNTYKHLWDYMTFATMNEDMPNLNLDEVVFLGYGIDDEKYSDYKGNNVRGKVIMINKGEPLNKDSISYFTGQKAPSEWTSNIWKKLAVAQAKGVKSVLIIEDQLKQFLDQNRRFLVSPSLELGDGELVDKEYANHIYISSTIAKDIIAKKDKKIKRWRKKNKKRGKAKDIKLSTDMAINFERSLEVIKGHNVMGYIEGTDKKDELIVISGHYDHLGKKGNDVYNGADDNGSGTSTVMEIAEAFTQAKNEGNGPRRSILCLLVTGEEKGLLGSEYYAENPIFPIESTVANVNIDMVGRVDKKYANNPEYIYVIGSDRLSTDLHKINEEMNNEYSQIIMDYKYNSEDDPNRYYFRSDHYNFAKKGIPAIFFFSGVHEDYHRTTDTVDKIMFDKMEVIGRHIFHLAWDLANRENRIVVDGVVK